MMTEIKFIIKSTLLLEISFETILSEWVGEIF